jgi:hypothetical protein
MRNEWVTEEGLQVNNPAECQHTSVGVERVDLLERDPAGVEAKKADHRSPMAHHVGQQHVAWSGAPQRSVDAQAAGTSRPREGAGGGALCNGLQHGVAEQC